MVRFFIFVDQDYRVFVMMSIRLLELVVIYLCFACLCYLILSFFDIYIKKDLSRLYISRLYNISVSKYGLIWRRSIDIQSLR